MNHFQRLINWENRRIGTECACGCYMVNRCNICWITSQPSITLSFHPEGPLPKAKKKVLLNPRELREHAHINTLLKHYSHNVGFCQETHTARMKCIIHVCAEHTRCHVLSKAFLCHAEMII